MISQMAFYVCVAILGLAVSIVSSALMNHCAKQHSDDVFDLDWTVPCWFIGIIYSAMVLMGALSVYAKTPEVPVEAVAYIVFVPHLVGLAFSYKCLSKYVNKFVAFIGRLS